MGSISETFAACNSLETLSFISSRANWNLTLMKLLYLALKYPLGKGQAAQLGASSGLGSESNVENIQKRDRKAFFNWISANDNIATAQGGGGGLALWKRVVEEQ